VAGSALLVLGLMPAAAQENAATKAVEAAKQYAGTTINTEEEAGLMAMLGINITGPEWEELTGIEVRVSEVPYEELFPKAMLEHRAGTGAYDMPRSRRPGSPTGPRRALAVDPHIGVRVKSEFDDVAAFRAWMTSTASYASVDGDVHIPYYRKDCS
jgi:multiple sugar transport system substrate-binding protein